MHILDWIVLVTTLILIIGYGVWKSRRRDNLRGYFLDHQSMPWYLILLSVMGTQASAITFLSAPGQAYTDGMRFVQYYFGLPLAMVVLCISFIPAFRHLQVFTAYEFLEKRFDLKTRALTAFLFLLQRALSTGISIYAPAIILSSLLGWNIYWTNIFIGGLLIIYTVSGGARSVAHTQKLQLVIIFAGMLLAAYLLVHKLPPTVSFHDALHLAGKLGKLNAVVMRTDLQDRDFWQDKYNVLSGIIGGFFLALSYFGTDQSQVGRYLTARSIRESRLGLLMNGIVKVPMQFGILLIGALVFAFYQFYPPPLFFNPAVAQQMYDSPYRVHYVQLQHQYDSLFVYKKEAAQQLVTHWHQYRGDEAGAKYFVQLQQKADTLRQEAMEVIQQALPAADHNDTNYIFLYFILRELPQGVVGLLIAVIFLAAWGSIAAALNALSSATVVDVYKRAIRKTATDDHYVMMSKWFTLFWGVFCILVAQFANRLGSLIEAVNVLGSLFYGTILGIFLCAFYVKKVKGTDVFWSAIGAEMVVLVFYHFQTVSFLWLNVIGCLLVMGGAFMWNAVSSRVS
ncbi:MAG: sodium:solute symporter [Thermoflavifilum sp.]|nr:sodium:solute symporter [Thermoflavifilum sp.]